MKTKILITGAGGFIGSHLVEYCIKCGYEVKAFIHYNSKNSWGWLEKVQCIDKVEIFTGDVRDYDSVYKAAIGCNSIFHLAALIGIPYSYVSPAAYIKTNIEGTYNILEASKNLKIDQVIITSTSETYGTAQYMPMDEKHPLVAQSPYSATKIAADQLAISYFRSFSLPVKIVRPFNTYGPRQSARAIIPSIITQLLTNNKKIVLGNLHTTRDLTYVMDTVAGFIEIYKSDKLFGEVTNIGMNNEISIVELAKVIKEIMDKKTKIVTNNERVRPSMSEVEKLRCNNTKILQHTSWTPSYNLEKGLKETIDWLKVNINYYKSSIYNV